MDKIDIIIMVVIIIIHYFLINALEKKIMHGSSHDINNRPDCDHKEHNKFKCMGTPSGHVETLIITLMFMCALFPKYIKIIAPISVVLVILMGYQRIFSKRHNLYQVIIGMFFGILYSITYMVLGPKMSMVLCMLVIIILTIACIIKYDYMIKNQKIPDYIDKSLYQIIDKKMNKKEKYFELLCLTWFPTIVQQYTWNDIEKQIDVIIKRVDMSSIDIVVGIKSGGAFIANYIGKEYNKEYFFIKLNSNIDQNEPLKFVSRLSNTDIYNNEVEGINTENIKGKNILLADDGVLSGRTLKKAISFLMSNGAKSVVPIALCRVEGKLGKSNKDIDNLIVYANCPRLNTVYPWGYCS